MKSLEKTASATPIFHPKIPMTKHHPSHDPFEEVKFLFISPKLSCETEHASSPLLELKACPSGNRNVVLDNGQ
jgi:hypothetical protein